MSCFILYTLEQNVAPPDVCLCVIFSYKNRNYQTRRINGIISSQISQINYENVNRTSMASLFFTLFVFYDLNLSHTQYIFIISFK